MEYFLYRTVFANPTLVNIIISNKTDLDNYNYISSLKCVLKTPTTPYLSADVFANINVGLKLNAFVCHKFHPPLDHLLAQLHGRDPILEQASNSIIPLIHCHQVARLNKTFKTRY